jgi:hypothetical protein
MILTDMQNDNPLKPIHNKGQSKQKPQTREVTLLRKRKALKKRIKIDYVLCVLFVWFFKIALNY